MMHSAKQKKMKKEKEEKQSIVLKLLFHILYYDCIVLKVYLVYCILNLYVSMHRAMRTRRTGKKKGRKCKSYYYFNSKKIAMIIIYIRFYVDKSFQAKFLPKTNDQTNSIPLHVFLLQTYSRHTNTHQNRTVELIFKT